MALSTSSLTARRGCLWRAPSALRPCIGTMNRVLLVLVLVLEDNPPNRGRGRAGRRGGNGRSWRGDQSSRQLRGRLSLTILPELPSVGSGSFPGLVPTSCTLRALGSSGLARGWACRNLDSRFRRSPRRTCDSAAAGIGVRCVLHSRPALASEVLDAEVNSQQKSRTR